MESWLCWSDLVIVNDSFILQSLLLRRSCLTQARVPKNTVCRSLLGRRPACCRSVSGVDREPCSPAQREVLSSAGALALHTGRTSTQRLAGNHGVKAQGRQWRCRGLRHWSHSAVIEVVNYNLYSVGFTNSWDPVSCWRKKFTPRVYGTYNTVDPHRRWWLQ